jgi:hypothetical protein
MSFGAGVTAYEMLAKANEGDYFDVTSQKNDKGFWDWVAIAPSSPTTAPTQAAPAAGGTAAPQRTFETAEERAARQVLIVRQSSISSAIEFFKTNTKKVPTTAEVLEVADAFVNYVFQKDAKPEAGIFEMEDDIPF